MTSIAIHEPVAERIRNVLKHLFRKPWRRADAQDRSRGFQFDLDVHEDEDSYVVIADLPGVDKKDIWVEVEKNQVSITATFKYPWRKNTSLLYAERKEGDFYRRLLLDFDIDRDQVKASCNDGVLELTLPKIRRTQRTTRLPVQ